VLADIGPLRRSAAYRRLWVGITLSSIGGSLTYFAVILQVYRLTHSSFAVGALGLSQVVPLLTVGLLAGSLTDAVDRRRLALVTGTVLAAVSVALAAQAFAGFRAVGLLYALVAVQSAVLAIDFPVRNALVPSLLPAEERTAGLALSRFSFQVTLVVGPALAGVIAAAPHLGVGACYLADAVSFLASLYGISRLPAMPPQAAARPGWRAVAEGARFIRRSQPLAGAFLADLNATVFGLPTALFPAINAARFGGSPRTLGLFTAAIGVGGLLSAVLSGPVLRDWIWLSAACAGKRPEWAGPVRRRRLLRVTLRADAAGGVDTLGRSA
jgi:MFS family permease